jgi:7-keto-8-aminopelargonate synthetase-like enzyme
MKPAMLADPILHIAPNYVQLGRRKLLYFGGCDYFRLSYRNEIRKAAARVLMGGGWNVAASRATTGNHPLYQQLETELASFFKSNSALFLPTGYAANQAVGQALAGQFTEAWLDAKCHASLLDAATFLGCKIVHFPHRDVEALQRLSRPAARRGRIIVLTDGVFGSGGTVARLKEYRRVLPPDAWMWVDDCHGAGVLGNHGRGTPEHEHLGRERLIQTTTLSKAFGAYGGVVLCNKHLKKTITTRSHAFIGGTPLPLPLAAAGVAAVQLLRSNQSMRRRLAGNMRRMTNSLKGCGLSIPGEGAPIIPIVPKHASDANSLCARLLKAGIHPPFIHYPGGPASGYFRFAISSEHSGEQLSRLIALLSDYAADRGSI